MLHLAYSVRYAVALINAYLLAITLYPSVTTTVAYDDSTFHDVTSKFDHICSLPPHDSLMRIKPKYIVDIHAKDECY